MLVIRIGKSVIFYFNPETSKVFLQVGLSACFFIGPALYAYIKSIVDPMYKTVNHWKMHLAILLGIVLIVGLLFPYYLYPNYWYDYIIDIIYWVWFAYLLITGYILKEVFQHVASKKDKVSPLEFWLLSIYIGDFIIWLAYRTTKYTSYIVGALSFTFLFYLLFVLIQLKKMKAAIFDPKEKYADKKIDNAAELIQKLEKLMVLEKLFANPKIKLGDIAERLGVTTHVLSQLLNDNIGKSLSLFLNEYRVEEAKRLLVNNDQYTLEAIGAEAGFSSKSSFYAAFKRLSGQTPAQYKRSHRV